MTETEDYSKSATPTAHKTTHQAGGADEVTVEGLAGELTAEQKSAWIKVSGKPATFAPSAHKDSHDPHDGADAVDTATPLEIAEVQTEEIGTSHALARADHKHGIQHSIADNHIVTIDDDDAADNDFARFTANGLEGRSKQEALHDLHKQYLSLTEGPFGQTVLYAAQLNNLFYAADKRFTITKTGTTSLYVPSGLFNGDYGDSPVKIADGNTVTLHFDLLGKGEYTGTGFAYSYGQIILHFYFTSQTTSVRARLKTKNGDAAHAWRDWVTGVNISQHSTRKVMSMDMQSNYHCQEVEVEITASGNDVWLAELEWNIDRNIDSRIFPLAQKYQPNNFFNDQTIKNSSNTIVAQFTTGGAGRLTGLSVYANNAAAVSGGLVAGDLYRTGGDPDTVRIVH